MKYICSLITVENMNIAKEFYINILNQRIKYDFGENIMFESGFAIHLRSHYFNLIDNKEIIKGSNSFELYFEYDDIDSFEKVLCENEVEFIHEVREQPWRQKVVRFYDPDKNIIEVGESIEHLSYRLSKEGIKLEEICRITNMPEEFVLNSIVKYK